MEIERHEWRGNHPGIPAEIAGQVFRELEEAHGSLRPADLVEASRPKNAPMHNAFEWDNRAAAEAYRQTQAQGYINSLIVVVRRQPEDEKPIRTRAFVSLYDATNGARDGYAEYLTTVVSDPALNAGYLARAKSEIASWAKKYRDLEELSDLVGAVEAFLQAA